MDRLDRAALALLAAGAGLSLVNILGALLGRPGGLWRTTLAGLLLAAGVAVLAVSFLRQRGGGEG